MHLELHCNSEFLGWVWIEIPRITETLIRGPIEPWPVPLHRQIQLPPGRYSRSRSSASRSDILCRSFVNLDGSVGYAKADGSAQLLRSTRFDVDDFGLFELEVTGDRELDPCYMVTKSPGDGRFIIMWYHIDARGL